MDPLQQAADILRRSSHITAFTGAGISVESGIPPFRGADGLWSRYDPVVLDISYFHSHPKEAWEVIREIFYDYFGQARPNPAHYILAEMEKEGRLAAVITQNIDNLHQEAGSREVIEYHGNSQRLICPRCGTSYTPARVDLRHLPPRCEKDGEVLKPDFVFFGEPIPPEAARRSEEEAHAADVFLVIGTTGEIMPASLIPQVAKHNGATIIEVNPEPSNYTHTITDILLQGKAGEILPALWEKMRS
jgi:NAD-dependent deacetylase